MLLKDGLIRCITYYFTAQSCQGTMPFVFEKNVTLKLAEREKVRRELIKTVLYASFAIILFAQMLHGANQERLVVSMQSLLFACGHLAFSFSKWMVLQRRENFKELFNLFLQFEKSKFLLFYTLKH